MPLSEQRRKQLDGIVQQMVGNKESDQNIQFVVNDFKSKYENESQPQQGGLLRSIASPFAKVATSIINAGSSINQLTKGNVQGAADELNKSRNINLPVVPGLVNLNLGQFKPAFTGQESTLGAAKNMGAYGAQIFSTIAPVGKVGTTGKALAGSMARFGTANALGDVGNQLDSGKKFDPIQTVGAFGLGAITPGITKAGGALLGGLKNKVIGSTAGEVLNKELQVPTGELAASIEKGIKSFGEKAAEIVDDKGLPLYRGQYKTLFTKAKTDLIQSGTKLNSLVKELDTVDPVIITRDQVAGDVIKQMENMYGKLTPTQIKQIQFEVARMPKKMNRESLVTSKRMYDGLIPDNFWTNTDQNAGFSTQVKYFLRDNARNKFNEVTKDTTARELNNRMSVAMDMKKLTSQQLASRQKQKNPLSLTNFISRIIDDTILNPAITTNVSQAKTIAQGLLPKQLQGLGSKVSGKIPASVKNVVTLPNLIRQSLNSNQQ